MTGGIPLKLDWLATLHSEKGLHLVTADRSGFVYLSEENPAEEATGATDTAARAFVSELIRLARLGQRVEEAALETVRRSGGEPLQTQ